MCAQGDGVGVLAEYDVSHIDSDQYRHLRALVLAGRAKARIVIVECDVALTKGFAQEWAAEGQRRPT